LEHCWRTTSENSHTRTLVNKGKKEGRGNEAQPRCLPNRILLDACPKAAQAQLVSTPEHS
jgi:hypothetical protein